MNGAESLARSLLASGTDTCFANPGTSEMHFVAALDRVEEMRCVLGLSETVVTGCADGYARMADKPAATLLHCGPGFANGISNIHNARRAHSPMVNIVGDQATYHRLYDPPLCSDIEGLARAVSNWVRTAACAEFLGRDAAQAVQAARSPPGQIATLIVPADCAWSDGGVVAPALSLPTRSQVAPDTLRNIARALRSGEPALLILSGQALSAEGLEAANRIAHATGARLRVPTKVGRIARGRGRVPVDAIPFGIDAALKAFAGVRHVILVGAPEPAAFFAHPGKPSLATPHDATTHVLARPEQDALVALHWLADELGAPANVPITEGGTPPRLGYGAFEPIAFGQTLAALLPENCIVTEDAVTSGHGLFGPTFNAAPSDWLQTTGGALGLAFCTAIGAAIACPQRKVVCLEGDGSGMYTLQALWTQAREQLDIVNVVFANRRYKILHGELLGVGAQPGPTAQDLFELSRPDLNWVKLAEGMGVEAACVQTLEGFADTFRAACARRGPFLIEFQI